MRLPPPLALAAPPIVPVGAGRFAARSRRPGWPSWPGRRRRRGAGRPRCAGGRARRGGCPGGGRGRRWVGRAGEGGGRDAPAGPDGGSGCGRTRAHHHRQGRDAGQSGARSQQFCTHHAPTFGGRGHTGASRREREEKDCTCGANGPGEGASGWRPGRNGCIGPPQWMRGYRFVRIRTRLRCYPSIRRSNFTSSANVSAPRRIPTLAVRPNAPACRTLSNAARVGTGRPSTERI